MAKRKTNRPSWSDVKAKLGRLDRKQLIGLVADLYRFSKENQAFLHARFGVGEDPLGPYKETISDCLYPDIYTDKPIRISGAKRAISSYTQAVGDPAGEAELMTFFVECGNSFTVNFGDIEGAFYDALILMFRRAIEKVLRLPEDQKAQFRDRLEEIVTSSSGIGWGYHDTLERRLAFTFEGWEEGDEVSGRGWATVEGNHMEGWFGFHLGDESTFRARTSKGGKR